MSIQLQNKYLIQVDQANIRDSLVFLEDCREQIANIFEQSNGTISKNQMACKSLFYKVSNGPQPTHRIVVNLRFVARFKDDGNFFDYQGYNLAIYMLKMDQEQIQYDKIYERPTKYQQDRDALIHPNGRQILILTNTTLQFYHIIKQLNSINEVVYSVKLMKKQNIKLNTPILSYDNIISPSGQFILGIAQFQQGQQKILKAMKIDLSTSTPFFSQPVNDFIRDGVSGIRKRGLISMDKDKLSKAVIVGNRNQVCILDIQTMQISKGKPFKSDDETFETIPIRVKQRNETIKINDTISAFVNNIRFVNSNYLQIIDGGYFALFDQQNIIKLMKIHNNDSISYNTIYYNQVGDTENDRQAYLTAQIPEIDSLVSIKRDKSDAKIYKYVYDGNFTLNMGRIELKTFQPFKASEIFHYQGNSEICFIFREKVMCYKIYTKCTPDSPKTLIKQCPRTCKELGKVWSPFQMQCVQCPQCQCNSNIQFYNFYRRRCQIDCSKVKNASYGSGYAYNTKCQCMPPYIWDQNLSLCRVNCDHIQNTDPNIDYFQLQVDQCKCLSEYRYINESISLDTPGICVLSCENGTQPIIKGKQQFCLCSQNENWDKRSLSCQKVIKNEIVFPVWSIVLIALFSLAILAIFGYFIKVILSIIKNKKKEKQCPQTPTTLNSPYSNQQKKMLQKTISQPQNQIAKEFICVICNKKKLRADCIGPCGDKYHIRCIKARFQIGNYQCPSCKRMLTKGYAQLDLIEENNNNK